MTWRVFRAAVAVGEADSFPYSYSDRAVQSR